MQNEGNVNYMNGHVKFIRAKKQFLDEKSINKIEMVTYEMHLAKLIVGHKFLKNTLYFLKYF